MKKLLVAIILLTTLLIPTAAYASASAIDQRYNSEPELRALLGLPIDPEWSIENGRMRYYEHGALYWSPTTGVHEAHGAIRDKFREIGGIQKLGFPITDEQDLSIKYDFNVVGRESVFEHGDVVFDFRTLQTYWMDEFIGQTWHENIYPYFNLPTSDQQPEEAGFVVHFYDAAIHEHQDKSTWLTYPEWTGL